MRTLMRVGGPIGANESKKRPNIGSHHYKGPVFGKVSAAAIMCDEQILSKNLST